MRGLIKQRKDHVMRKLTKRILPLTALLAACSSTIPKAQVDSTALAPIAPTGDIVIARIDNLDRRPDWAKESDLIKSSDGQVLSLGSATIPADHRLEAGLRIAVSNATEPICKLLSQKMDFIFQNSEEGTAGDAQIVRSTGAQACQASLSGIRATRMYWEKVLTYTSTREQSLIYRIFASAQISESEIKIAMNELAKKRSKGPLTKEFSKMVEDQASRIVSDLENQPVEAKPLTPKSNE